MQNELNMLTQKWINYLLNSNYSFDLTMSADNSSMISERKELQIRTKTMYRREPSLSPNVTLLIECGTVILVLTIVGIIFYCSQRNFKKRSNAHRRRWLESDANIESYSDGQFSQIYDTSAALEDYQSQPIDLDQDDCPPPYDSVVRKSRKLSHKNRHSVANKNQIHRNNSDELVTNLPKRQSNVLNETNTNMGEDTSEALIPSGVSICIVAETDETSSLIESGDLSLSLARQNCYADEECTIRRKCLKDEFKVNVHGSRNSQMVRTGKHTDKNVNIEPTRTVDSENEVLLDASGLPSYDTAIKIQECGNI